LSLLKFLSTNSSVRVQEFPSFWSCRSLIALLFVHPDLIGKFTISEDDLEQALLMKIDRWYLLESEAQGASSIRIRFLPNLPPEASEPLPGTTLSLSIILIPNYYLSVGVKPLPDLENGDQLISWSELNLFEKIPAPS